MTANMPKNKTLDYALRALQLIFAIIVMGTDGYAIHVFRGHTVYEHFVFGNFYDYYGVPDAWGFLMFCAGWTVVIVLFHLIAGTTIFADQALVGYIHFDGYMFGRKELMWVARGSDSFWGARMAAVHGHRSPESP
ncbi:hypothetical protein N7486_005282 [Penicillium sp. IBT 16267x]|nr:hypothetical protein N7486_005282 [Penicillium sp. IBT 16267x]